MIFSGPQSPVLNVITVLLGIPGAILAVIVKSYRIKVDGSTFTVNRGFRKTYTFDVSDIDRIKWKIHMTQWGRMDIIRIETDSYRRHFRIETYMEGFEKMINYLESHVPESKIEYRKKTFHNAI
jgi:riboflavin synthase alpha subunit